MKKIAVFIAVIGFCLTFPASLRAHGDVTPAKVITDMKSQGKGPYASPIFRGRSLSQDWLGLKGNSSREGGVLIDTLVKDGPAEEGDLQKGDLIVAVDGNLVNSQRDLDALLSKIKKPSEVDFTVLRQGEEVNETIYMVPNLAEMAPEMADMFERGNKPEPGKIMNKMFAQTPMGKGDNGGRGFGPGMFADEMMQRSPMGKQPRSSLTIHSTNPVENFLMAVQNEISLISRHQKDLGLSDEQVQRLNELDLEAKKQIIKINADLKIVHLELEQLLQQTTPNLNKLKGIFDTFSELQQKKHQQVVDLLEKYYNIIDKETRAKLKSSQGD